MISGKTGTNSFINNGGNVGINMTSPSVALDVTGDIEYTGTITDVSDERLKENIQDLDGALALLARLDGKSFNMKGSASAEFGFIAQNVQLVLPDAVSVVDLENGYLGVSYLDFIPWLVEGIKELYEKVVALMQSDEAQNARIQQLENEVAALVAAGASRSGEAPEAPAALPASEASDSDEDSIAPNDDDPATAATSTVEISLQANDNEPVAADEAAQEVQEATPEPANDNHPAEDVPATGTE